MRPVLAKVKAEYAYQGMPVPDKGPPLLFMNGDVFDLLSESDDHWWEGRKDGKEGFFPKDYVRKHRTVQPGRGYEESTVNGGQPPPRKFSLPATPPAFPTGDRTRRFSLPPFMEEELANQPWFVGKMERGMAQKWLEPLLAGTFLIRESMNVDRPGQYALSIKFGSNVRHIKVNQSPSDSLYYLAECKKFRSIPELVHFYQRNTLEDSFPELQTTLTIPYKDALRTNSNLGMCTAQFDYAANQPNQLSLRVGDRIVILSRAGGFRGWWKGSLNGRTGYFPRAYVIEDEETNSP
jgi:guanine nucleotide exchange factor VAV